jgi:hypothetical protein
MTGLPIKELIARGDSGAFPDPGAQWFMEQCQDDLWDQFQREIISREAIKGCRSDNPFAKKDLVIARLIHSIGDHGAGIHKEEPPKVTRTFHEAALQKDLWAICNPVQEAGVTT